jgi:hypothetical protein
MQIVQSHLTQNRVKNVALCELHSTHSVTTITEAVSRYLELRLNSDGGLLHIRYHMQ